MKVQWQLVNIETHEKLASIGEPFELSDIAIQFAEQEFIRQYTGTRTGEPMGILENSHINKSNMKDICSRIMDEIYQFIGNHFGNCPKRIKLGVDEWNQLCVYIAKDITSSIVIDLMNTTTPKFAGVDIFRESVKSILYVE